jgi:hypothetical protein
MKIKEATGYLEKLEKVTKSDVEFPVSVAYKIAKNKKNLNSALEVFFDQRNELIKKYSNGTMKISMEDEGYLPFIKDVTDLVEQEAGAVDILKISLDQLGDGKIPMDVMDSLMFMIEE